MRRSLVRSTIERGTCFRLILIAACCVSLVACDSESLVGQSEEATGEMTVFIPLAKAVQSQIARAEVVVSAAGMSNITEALSINGSSMSGTVIRIPAGADRLFTLNTYDSSGSLNYTGSAMADIVVGELVRVEVTLRSVDSPVGGPVLKVIGKPSIIQGYYSGGSWDSGGYYDDVRITGEIENQGTITAESVRITVTLRDSSGNLMARWRDEAVGTIQSGDSELFVLFSRDVFTSSNVLTSSWQVDVEINHD